jgi:serine protease
MHLRVLGKDGGTDADIAQAVLYAARLSNASGTLPPQRADVINLSLGGPGSTSSLQNAINSAFNAGVVVFAAAGNNNSGTAFFPASYSHVVSVSAVDINARRRRTRTTTRAWTCALLAATRPSI